MEQIIFGGIFMSDKKRLVKALVVGCLCGVLTCAIFTGILAAVILSAGLLPDKLTDYVMISVAAAGAFVGGLVAAKLNKGAGLIVGVIVGAGMFLLLTVAGLSSGGASFSSLSAVRIAALLVGGVLGGILGVKERRHTAI